VPFKNAAQEMALKINDPTLWKRWVKKYGHAPGWAEYQKRAGRKAARTRKRSGK